MNFRGKSHFPEIQAAFGERSSLAKTITSTDAPNAPVLWFRQNHLLIIVWQYILGIPHSYWQRNIIFFVLSQEELRMYYSNRLFFKEAIETRREDVTWPPSYTLAITDLRSESGFLLLDLLSPNLHFLNNFAFPSYFSTTGQQETFVLLVQEWQLGQKN